MNIRILEESARVIRRRFGAIRPVCGLVLGSGWDAAIGGFRIRNELSFARLPALGRTRVAGHAGLLLLAENAGLETLVFLGRRHWYEGAGWEPVAMPIYAMKKFGAGIAVLTNAAGGIRRGFASGAFMAISDHINAMGDNPLRGAHDPFWGPRFPDQSSLYDPELRDLLNRSGASAGIRLAQGVYIGVPGPAYETPAEIRAFAKLGADAVGMSTVPEAILAGAAGLKVAGISLISNPAAGLSRRPLNHAEVRASGVRAAGQMRALLDAFWKEMASARVAGRGGV